MYFKTNTTLHYTIYNTVLTLLYLPENNRNTRKGDKSAAKSNRARNEIASNERLPFFLLKLVIVLFLEAMFRQGLSAQ